MHIKSTFFSALSFLNKFLYFLPFINRVDATLKELAKKCLFPTEIEDSSRSIPSSTEKNTIKEMRQFEERVALITVSYENSEKTEECLLEHALYLQELLKELKLKENITSLYRDFEEAMGEESLLIVTQHFEKKENIVKNYLKTFSIFETFKKIHLPELEKPHIIEKLVLIDKNFYLKN